MSPTDFWDETRRLKIARRFGSEMISNTVSTFLIYSKQHIPVKAYKWERNSHFILATIILGAISLMASYIPAKRAMSVDPMLALSDE
jgi:ABC-type lipoprotein release transport system permease subunit